jgi:hypothetical protein
MMLRGGKGDGVALKVRILCGIFYGVRRASDGVMREFEG